MKRRLFGMAACLAALLPGTACAVMLQPIRPAHQQGEVFVYSVIPDSPAAKAGIQVDDVVVQASGRKLGSCAELVEAAKTATDELALDVLRDGRPLHVRVITAGAAPGAPKLGVLCMGGNPVIARGRSQDVDLSAAVIAAADLVIAKVAVLNLSSKPFSLGPELFSMADANRSMLRPMSLEDVDLVLKKEQALAKTQAPAPAAGNSGLDFAAQAALASLGIRGPAAAIVSGLMDHASNGLAGRGKSAAPSSLESQQEAVRRLSLAASALDPSYRASGLIYFAPTREFPVTLLMTVGSEKISLEFKGP